MQARDRAVDEWFSRISSGQVQLPRFQCFEAWGNREVQDLLETVLAELLAGATLILEVGDTPLFRYRPLQSAPTYNALNCALVTWRTNRTIAAKQPVKYILERAEASALGEEELRSRLRSHAIPYEAMLGGDYEEFLLKRALIAETAVKILCAGGDWTPSDAVE